jgi:hypothetical protein
MPWSSGGAIKIRSAITSVTLNAMSATLAIGVLREVTRARRAFARRHLRLCHHDVVVAADEWSDAILPEPVPVANQIRTYW